MESWIVPGDTSFGILVSGIGVARHLASHFRVCSFGVKMKEKKCMISREP